MMKAIMIQYEVFQGGELKETSYTSVFGIADYSVLFRNAISNLHMKYVGCSVYAKEMKIL